MMFTRRGWLKRIIGVLVIPFLLPKKAKAATSVPKWTEPISPEKRIQLLLCRRIYPQLHTSNDELDSPIWGKAGEWVYKQL